MNREIIDYPFIPYPRVFLDSPLFSQISIEARILLALILDRHGLSSIHREKFTDENDGIYVIYTVSEICRKFRCGKKKVMRLFRELESSGLILRKRINGNKPYRIYLTQLFLNGLKQDFAKCRNDTLQSAVREPCKVSESALSNNNKSNNDYSNIHSSIKGFARTEDEIREQIEYDCIVCDDNRKVLDEIVMLISDVFNGRGATLRIGKDEMPRGVVISRFCRLDSEHILYVLSQIENNTRKIENIRSYIITMLYNAPATMETDVAAEFAFHHKNNQDLPKNGKP